MRFLTCSLVALLGGTAARSAEPTKTELHAQLAATMADVQKLLKSEKADALALGEFVSLQGKKVNIAPGLQMAVLSACQRHSIKVADEAKHVLHAEYQLIQKPGNDFFTLEVAVKVVRVNAAGGVTLTLKAELGTKDMRDLSGCGGATVKLAEDGSAQKRNAQLAAAITEPEKCPPHIHGGSHSLVSTEKGSPFAVELLAGPEGGTVSPRGVKLTNGLPYTEIKRGEEYRVRLVNTSKQEVAARVLIDGIDVFAFTDDRTKGGDPRYSHWIVPAADERGAGELEIPGWHKTAAGDGKYLAFLVTEYGKGASQKVRPEVTAGKIGQVTVTFAKAYPKGSRNAGETGFGRPIPGKQEVVERDIDVVCEMVTIRYNRPADKK